MWCFIFFSSGSLPPAPKEKRKQDSLPKASSALGKHLEITEVEALVFSPLEISQILNHKILEQDRALGSYDILLLSFHTQPQDKPWLPNSIVLYVSKLTTIIIFQIPNS